MRAPVCSTRLLAFLAWTSIATTTAACGAAATETPKATGSWYELRTPRFRLWTDGDAQAARALVVDLERFHQVLLAQTSAEEREAAPPLRIYLTRDRASFAALTGGKSSDRGLVRPTMRGTYAILDGTSLAERDAHAAGARALLFREYARAMSIASGARAPSWYDEGLAEYLSTTEFRDDGTYAVGCAPPYRPAGARSSPWLPMERLLDAGNVAALGGDGRTPADVYAQSWYAVHYFSADQNRKRQLNEYLRLWATGSTSSDAVQSAFGMSTAELDRVLRRYAAAASFACKTVAPEKPLVGQRVDVIPLDPGSAQQRVGDLLLETVGPTQGALDALARAAKQRPDDPATLLALARAHWLKAERGEKLVEELAEARRLLAQAGQRASGSAEALALEGHVRRTQTSNLARAGEPYGDVLLEARKAYRAAIRADETIAEAYVGLGATYLIEDNGSEEAQVALEAAAYLVPFDLDVALMLGTIQVVRHNALQAIPALEHVVRFARDDAQRRAAESALRQLRADAAAKPATGAETAPATAPSSAAPVAPPE